MNRRIARFAPAAMLAAACCLVAHAPAQDRGRSVTFRVLCFEHAGDLTTLSVPGPGAAGARTEVPLYTSSFSDDLQGVFSGGRARLFAESEEPDGKPGWKVVADGKLVDSPRQAFVLVPAEESDKGLAYRVVAFDDRENRFPMGATMVLNFAPFPVRLNVAGADLPPIAPGDTHTYPLVRNVDEWNMFSVRIDFGTGDDQWTPVSTQSWKASPRKRDWVITRFDPTTRQPVIRIYQDVPPWRRPKPAGTE